MAENESGQGFRVTDRRRGGGDEEPSPTPAPPRREETSPTAMPEGDPEDQGQRDLVGLFMMLGSLAIASLEGVPDPATGRVQRDPGQAAEVIDLLLLLREKTEGRRTPEETQALDEVIYELQVRYVKATTRG